MRPRHWRYTIPLRLRSVFRRVQADRKFNDELRGHLEQKTRQYVGKGMTTLGCCRCKIEKQRRCCDCSVSGHGEKRCGTENPNGSRAVTPTRRMFERP